MAYPKTDKEFVAMLEKAAAQKTFYRNSYPYNLGYYHGDGTFSFDCVNLDKAILNGWQPIKTKGYYISSLGRTGDCTEWGLLSQCQYSTDFSKMNCVAVLYKPGHIGNYLGKEVTKNGKVYNVIECTNMWDNGVLYSYVDSKGRKYRYKGASQSGAWTHWGKLTKWLSYETSGSTADTSLTKGSSGAKVIEMQKMLIALGYSCGSAGADGDFGKLTFNAVKKFQKDNGLYVDGIYGPITKAKLEEKYKAITPKKSVDEIANEVIAGKWGSGVERKQKLTAAGYDYTTIQNRVNELVKNNPAQSYNKDIAKTFTTTYALNMRKGPGLQNAVITVIPKNAQVECDGYYTNEWYYVKYGTYIGFCHKDYLK